MKRNISSRSSPEHISKKPKTANRVEITESSARVTEWPNVQQLLMVKPELHDEADMKSSTSALFNTDVVGSTINDILLNMGVAEGQSCLFASDKFELDDALLAGFQNTPAIHKVADCDAPTLQVSVKKLWSRRLKQGVNCLVVGQLGTAANEEATVVAGCEDGMVVFLNKDQVLLPEKLSKWMFCLFASAVSPMMFTKPKDSLSSPYALTI